MPDPTSKVRELNDRLRSTFIGGVVLLSNGVASLDDDAKRRLLAAVRTFEAFSPGITTPTANMISARSRLAASGSCSRSITTTDH